MRTRTWIVLATLLTLAVVLLVTWRMSRHDGMVPGGHSREVAGGATEEPAPPVASSEVTKREADSDHDKAGAKNIQHSKKTKLVDFSRRDGGAVAVQTPRQTAALKGLTQSVPGLKVDFDPLTGTPSNIMAPGRMLADAVKSEDDPHAPVMAFIDSHTGLFGHDSSALKGARISRDDVTAHNGMRTTVWQQQVSGVPFYKTILRANVTRDGSLITVGSQFMKNAEAAIGMGAAERAALVASPPVDAAHAVSLAAANVGDAVAVEKVASASAASGAERRQSFQAPLLSDTLAQLSWLPMSADAARLTWDVTLMSLKQNEMFRILVDAQTGEVLMRTSLTSDISDASFRVYADAATKKPFDSPNPMLPGTPTPSGAQAPEVPRQLVTLQALDTTASPNGWINDGVTETLGNNVDAHTDTNADNSPDLPRPASASRVFDFAMDLTQAPSTYKDAAVVHLFYMNNWMHDQLYGLGFTESAGNFQTNNFGRGGSGNDAVQADAQDGSGTNNANMSTPSDGSPPRMQMYVFTGPTPDRDGDFDDVVLLHEYTHGLSNRLVGGGVGISALATGGMGEGWSDFYGLALMADPASDPNAVYPGGSYATLNFVSGMTTNYYYGIRRYPYSTDMTKNPLTFKDIDPTQASPHTGIPLSPLFGSSNSNPSEVHNVGEVWCMALWECRASLITKYGAAGNQKMLQLTTDAMKLCPANPNLLQSRDAIIQADVVDNAGANRNELWAAFAKRGMGASATSPASSTTTGVVESYDLPDNLGVSPSAAYVAIGNSGGPFSPATQTYTLTNNSASALNWTAAKAQSWLTLSATSGALAAGATATVTATINSGANSLADGTYADTVSFTNTTSGAVISRGVTLRVGVKDYYTELFDTTTNDTDNQSWLFTPNGTQSFYSVQRTASVVSFPADPTGGTTLSLSDDSYSQITLSGGSQVKLYGTSYSSCYVGSNGYITFTAGDTAYSESQSSHFAARRVTALMDDLNPATGGTISWRQLADRVAVTWQNVPEYGTTNQNSFQIELFFDGRVRITCLGIAATDGLIGLSQGLGIPVDFVESDFSTYPSQALALTLPATVTEGDGVLAGAGTVTLTPVQAADVTVAISSGNTAEVTVPATLTIPAGQTSVTFDVTIVNDSVLDGSQTATITASAAGFSSAAGVIAVRDNETTALTVAAPVSASESAGTVTGTVFVGSAVGRDTSVSLTSSDTTEITVPATATILAGQTSATFNITVVDDTVIDGAQNATITASVSGWTSGTATIQVTDNENTNLTLTLPSSVTEGTVATATVATSGTVASPLVVFLSSNNTAHLTVPSSVTIPAGGSSASINLTAPDNALREGLVSASVTATASGFIGASGTTSVLDNDVHHFTISAVGATQLAGTPFSVTITAKDVNDVTMVSYTAGTPLSAAGSSGVVSISPATAGPFAAGVWTGSVTAATVSNNVVLTVSDGAGHAGSSNSFNVTTGPLHHFAWSTQPSSRVAGTPFAATVTAQDAANNTVSSFSSTATLSGYVLNPAGSTVVITELNPNTPDEIEFMNVTTASVNLSGWQVYIYDNTSWPAPLAAFTVPAGTTCSPGQIFRLQESGAAPGAFPQFYYGTNIDWTSGSTSLNAVLLRDGSGNMVDFLCTASATAASITSPAVIPSSQWSGATVGAPSNTTYGYARIGASDNNVAGDWTTATPGLGTVNPGLTTPFPASTTPVTMTPATSGTFVGGVWTGSITITQTATQMKLRADNGSGLIGDSNAFDVLTAPPNLPPSIAGGAGGQAVNDNAMIAPFSGVTIDDGDTPAQTLAVSVSLDAVAKGAFTTLNGFASAGGGLYTFSGTAATATTAIRGMVFSPTPNRVAPGATETTIFTISADDGIAAPVTNNTTTIISTSINDAPVITGQQVVSTAEDVAVSMRTDQLIVADPDNAYPTGFTLRVLDGTNYTHTGNTVIPSRDFNGSLSVSVVVNDGLADSNVFALAITVTAVNDSPVIAGQQPMSVLEDGSVAITLASLIVGDPDDAYPNGFTLTVEDAANYTRNGNVITPSADFYGTLLVPVFVSDGLAASNTFHVSITVTPVNDAPTLGAITNPAPILEDAPQQSVSLAGIAAGGEESQTLTVTAVSDNPALIPNPVVTYTSPATTGSLAYTPVPDASGTATITVAVHDDGGTANGGVDTVTRTFTVTVTPVNDAPTLAAITDPAPILEDAPQQSIPLAGISAGGGESQLLTVTAVSDNPSLIPNPQVTYTSANTFGSLTYAAAPDGSGTAKITVTVHDDGGTASGGADSVTREFNVVVTPVNDAPTLGPITNPAAILEDAPQQAVALAGISAGGGESQPLSITAVSSNPALIPNPLVNYSSPTATGSLAYTPVHDASGTATITVTVRDDGGTTNGGADTVTRSFVVTVMPVNDAPTLAAIDDPGPILEDAPKQTVSLTGIGAGGGESQSLLITAASSNPALIPNPTVVYANGSTGGTLTYTPVADSNGTAVITITVQDDGGSASGGQDTVTRIFSISVTPVNDAPTISDLADQTINEDTVTNPLSVNVTDIDSSPLALTFGTSSSNTALVPEANVVLRGLGTTRTLTVIPLPDQFGTTTITVWVTDGEFTASDTFVLTVLPVNDPPAITFIADQVIENSGSTGPVAFTVGDAESDAAVLVVSAESSNAALVPSLNITFGGSGENRTINIANAPSLSGSAVITVSVSDGEAVTSRIFNVAVNAPEIGIEQPAGSSVADGGGRDFGFVLAGSAKSLDFSIANTGNTDLTGVGVSLDGADAAQFAVAAQPAVSVGSGGGVSPFVVRFTPTSPGVKTATLHIASNDADENPFDITLTGTGMSVDLASLAPSSGTLAPAFAAATTSYTVLVSTATTSVTLRPVLVDASATVKVNGTAVISGASSAPVNLLPGVNAVSIEITARDGVEKKTYQVNVRRGDTKAQLTSPANGSTLASSTLPLKWNAGAGVSQIFLFVGTTAGGYDLYAGNEALNLSKAVTVPADKKIHVSLWSMINGAWQPNYYVFDPVPSVKAALVSPADGSTLAGGTLNLAWDAGVGASKYALWLGSVPGGYDLGALDAGLDLTHTFAVPLDGGPVYLTLWSLINGAYQSNSYWFTTAPPASGNRAARLQSPANATALSATTLDLNWDDGAGATSYAVWVGSSAGGYDIFAALLGSSHSTTVVVPGDGRRIHVTLHSLIGGAWQSNSYHFTCANLPDKGAAQIVSPASGSVLSDALLPLAWTSAAGATQYALWVGTTPGGYNLYAGYEGLNLGKTVSNMPLDGSPVYVTLYSLVNGAYLQSNTWFTAANSGTGGKRVRLVSPSNTATLGAASTNFTWDAGTGVTNCALWIGSSAGTYDLFSAGVSPNSNRTVTLPTDGRKIHVTLYSLIGGVYQSNSYQFTAASIVAERARVTAPANGSVLPGGAVTFAWSASPSATAYAIWIGRKPGAYDVYAGAEGSNLFKTLTSLPIDGGPVYLTIYSLINGTWQSDEAIYQAALP